MLAIAQRSRARRSSTPVDGSDAARQEAVPRHTKEDAWCVHESGVDGANHSNDSNKKDQPPSIASEKQHGGIHRWHLRASEMVHVQDVKERRIHQ